jgi:hypothetical protein
LPFFCLSKCQTVFDAEIKWAAELQGVTRPLTEREYGGRRHAFFAWKSEEGGPALAEPRLSHPTALTVGQAASLPVFWSEIIDQHKQAGSLLHDDSE